MSRFTQVVNAVLDRVGASQSDVPAEATPLPAQEPAKVKELVDTRDKYSEQLVQLVRSAIEQGELESYVDASIRELSWIAVSRNKPTVILGEMLSKLSWYVLDQSRYLEAQKELEQTQKDGLSIH